MRLAHDTLRIHHYAVMCKYTSRVFSGHTVSSSGCGGIAMKKTRPLFLTICSHWKNGQTVSKQDGPASTNGHEKIKVLTGEDASWAAFHQGNQRSPSVGGETWMWRRGWPGRSGRKWSDTEKQRWEPGPGQASLLGGQRSPLNSGKGVRPRGELGPGPVMRTGEKSVSMPTILASHWNDTSLETTSFNHYLKRQLWLPFGAIYPGLQKWAHLSQPQRGGSLRDSPWTWISQVSELQEPSRGWSPRSLFSSEGNEASPIHQAQTAEKCWLLFECRCWINSGRGLKAWAAPVLHNRALAGFFITLQKRAASFFSRLPENIPPAPSSVLSARRNLQTRAVHGDPLGDRCQKEKERRRHGEHAPQMRSVRQGPSHCHYGPVLPALGH